MFHFHSNQKLQVSGDLQHTEQLEAALDFALKYADYEVIDLCYQKGADGLFCLGWVPYSGVLSGWEKFPAGYTKATIIRMIIDHMQVADAWVKPGQQVSGDGDFHKGFLMECMDGYSLDNIENQNYGIVSFKPFLAFYHK